MRGVALAFVDLFRPFLGALAWVGAVVALAVVLGLAFRLGGELLRIAVLVAVAVAVGFAALAGIGALLGLVPGAFWESVRSVAGAVVAVVLGAFVLATVGRLFLDQLRSGAHAGSGRTGVVMGAVAVGSTLALLMLVGNLFAVYDLYPDSIATWARATVLSDAPKFDAAMTLVVVGLCGIGVLRNLSRMRPEPDPLTFRRSLVYTVMGMITAGAIAALDKATSDD
ncbi:hypothetical protein ACFQV2_09550 [Actinokineospora soli]|uniref:CvpA family protein n=1 Tax=Actinokineospora soli TaxID=1048753 RepID=A0ABW2TK36_9PSEU